MNIIHVYNDGSTLQLYKSQQLIQIPIWKGNRILDALHVDNIKKGIKSIEQLDSGYKIVSYPEVNVDGNTIEQKYIVDGQHRLSVLKDAAFNNELTNFIITVTVIKLNDEIEAIQYFNQINTVKPIQFKEDPILIANKYISYLIKKWPNQQKMKYFRSGITKRPYMSIDKLREHIIGNIDKISIMTLEYFYDKMLQENNRILHNFPPKTPENIIERSKAIKFALASSNNCITYIT